MSHSFRKAFYTISKRMAENVHSVARRRVKQKLHTMDPKEPDASDLNVIDSDTKELGLEDWGTKFGLEFSEDEYWEEEKKKAQRK